MQSYFTVMPRRWWYALPPKYFDEAARPANIAILTQTGANIGYSHTFCVQELRRVQERQMERGGVDIAYNFMIGSHGEVFEGRGWNTAPQVPSKFRRLARNSISIAFIGDFRNQLPNEVMFDAAHKLLRLGVERKLLTPNFLEYSSTFWNAPCVDKSNEVITKVLER